MGKTIKRGIARIRLVWWGLIDGDQKASKCSTSKSTKANNVAARRVFQFLWHLSGRQKGLVGKEKRITDRKNSKKEAYR